ncbi:MAG: hypothetical protein EOO39_00630 [Cytophagaceae bacterium]|nr:MAG: hypothetical protein EOO39_00630 [Cytophagaceae bacterium]
MRKSKNVHFMHNGVNINRHMSTPFWVKAFTNWNGSDASRVLDSGIATNNQRRAFIQLKLTTAKTPRPSLR